MAHIVLLGDSILDNKAYTKGGPDVISQLRELLPEGWNTSLLAIDGSTTEDVPSQVSRIPSSAAHLVLSVGGNDALMNSDLLLESLDSAATALRRLAEVSARFEKNYRGAVDACQKTGMPLAICTIYNGNFPSPEYQRLASTALMVFNDVILRVGFELGLTIIDLRFVCSSAEDYANEIEPSSHGGAKIARCILASLRNGTGRAARVMIG
jgi:hypothetical protein